MLCWCRAVPVAVRGAEHTKKGVRIACVGVACEIGRVAGRDNRTNNQKHAVFTRTFASRTSWPGVTGRRHR